MQDGLWVSNDPTPDGVYRTTILIDQDFSMVLEPDRAVAYARTFVDAGVRAQYDAGVYAQLTGMGIAQNQVGHFIRDLRAERPELDQDAIAPLRLEPGVNSKGKPFVGMHLSGGQAWQLGAQAAMNHGKHVLEVIVAADYDAGYHRILKGLIGVEDHVARGTVGALREQMERLSASEEEG